MTKAEECKKLRADIIIARDGMNEINEMTIGSDFEVLRQVKSKARIVKEKINKFDERPEELEALIILKDTLATLRLGTKEYAKLEKDIAITKKYLAGTFYFFRKSK